MKVSPTYVSLFSSGGLGCFGLKEAGFECVGTAEIIGRRIEVQRANEVCKSEDSYFNIDLTDQTAFLSMIEQIKSTLSSGARPLDILTATPPCQGMSVANHKKADELPRNSLVIKSIEAVSALTPNVFVFENVRSFLTTQCLDLDGSFKTIREAIVDNLSGMYNIDFRIVNLKDFGSPSSRTRTIVIGTRINLTSLIPSDVFPKAKRAPNLRQLIGHLPKLSKMGEISKNDVYHSFRKYDLRMLPWIQATPQGKSAFENEDVLLRPHQVINGEIVPNKSANGDKYQRQSWSQVAPCVHTRNDILASQNTVHPVDDRVFSIRELMLMMGVPNSFKWSNVSNLNKLDDDQKREYLSKHEINIRQCLGEGVPTPVFESIGRAYADIGDSGFEKQDWVTSTKQELANPNREALSAFYTNPGAVHALLSALQVIKKKNVRVLEPSCGNGAMMLQLIEWFSQRFSHTEIVLLDIDPVATTQAKKRLNELVVPPNVTVEVRTGDFLTDSNLGHFDYVVGNPPYGKFKRDENLFVSFLRKARNLSIVQGLIIPKSFVQAAEYKGVRDSIESNLVAITDLGEFCFKNVLIETICLVLSNEITDRVRVTSWPTGKSVLRKREYLTDSFFPSWLIYRNKLFDKIMKSLDLDVFETYRDRSIRRVDRVQDGDVVLYRSKNIGADGSVQGPFETISGEKVPKSLKAFLKKSGSTFIVPNLTYYPRIAELPDGGATDGSCAVLKLKGQKRINQRQVEFFCSEEFFWFYRIAMNYSTRSLNVDRISVFYYGLLKAEKRFAFHPRTAGPREILKWNP